MVRFVTMLTSGLWLGSTYALIALGLVLIFRATRTFNFAHGELMVFGAYIVARFEARHYLPTYLTVVVAILATAIVSVLFYLLALQKTAGMQIFVPVVVTMGSAAVGDGAMAIIFGPSDQYLRLPGLPTGVLAVGGAHVSSAEVALGIFGFLLAVLVAVVLRFTRLGTRIRSAGQDPVLASQGGIHVRRIYMASWAVAGALAAIAGICYGSTNVVNTSVITLALSAFPAMLLGGLDSVEGAIVGGIVIGTVQSGVAIYGSGQLAGVTSYIVLLVVLLVLPNGLFGTREATAYDRRHRRQRRAVARGVDAGLVATARRRAGALFSPSFLIGLGVLGAVSLFFTFGQSEYNTYTYNLCLLAVLGSLALNLLMGTVGQASIGNAAFIAAGAFGAAYFGRLGLPFPSDVIAAGVAAGAVGLVVGLPALRIRGLYLVLATLAAYYIVIYFATSYQSDTVGAAGFSPSTLFQSYGLTGQQRRWIWVLTGVVVIALIGMRCLADHKTGRAWRLIRDHEIASHVMGIQVTRYKLAAFALSSAMLGIEGGLLAHLTGSVSTDDFPLSLSISYIAMVVIGGLDSMLGAVIGAGLITALPIVVPNLVTDVVGGTRSAGFGTNVATIIYGVLIIIFVTRAPRGLAGWLGALWHRLASIRRLDGLAGRSGRA